MAHAYFHALSSQKQFGFKYWQSTYTIHSKLDESKCTWTDQRHRHVLHHDVGIRFVTERFQDYSSAIELIDAEIIPKIGEQHLREDFGGFVPGFDAWWVGASPPPRKIKTYTPEEHALMDVEEFGKRVGDTREVHLQMEWVSELYPDNPYSDALFHSSFGIWQVEWKLGIAGGDYNGKVFNFPVRTLAERHVQREYGTIPTVESWGKCIKNEPWMCANAIKLSKQFK